MKGIRDTTTDTFRKIMGNGLSYHVPKFQRDYSWENEQWDDLWQDLITLENGGEEAHYMGYLVLQTDDDRLHRIIDGQQRLTTICILILAVLKNLRRMEEAGIELDERRRKQLRNSYIGYLDPVSLISKNKLQLNRHNDSFYRTYLVPLLPVPKRGLKASEKLLAKCFEWFDKALEKKFKAGEEITAFIDKITDKLFFTVITVDNELNAYKVFETLNARGVRLSSSDLLKNYLFSIVDASGEDHASEFDALEDLWEGIIGKLGSEKLPDFLRYYWNSFNKTVRKNDLFKAIKRDIKSKADVFDLLRNLMKNADVFVALKNPEDEFWDGNKIIKTHLRELKIFGAKQPLSLLLSAYGNLPEHDFISILKICSVIYFRYNIIGGLNPNDEEGVFNRIANYIDSNKKFQKVDFKEIYPTDDTFEADFTVKQLKYTSRNSKIIKYIFVHLENELSGTDVDFESDRNTIEHILPENPGDEWELSEEEMERSRFRLGNLTLLEKVKNKRLKNAGYESKREVFSESEFKMTQKISNEYAEWNETQISRRQRQLAKKAKSIWKIQF